MHVRRFGPNQIICCVDTYIISDCGFDAFLFALISLLRLFNLLRLRLLFLSFGSSDALNTDQVNEYTVSLIVCLHLSPSVIIYCGV